MNSCIMMKTIELYKGSIILNTFKRLLSNTYSFTKMKTEELCKVLTTLNAQCFCLSVSVGMESHNEQSNSNKSNHLIGWASSFRSLVHLHHTRKSGRHAGRHDAGEEAEVLHLYPKAARKRLSSRDLIGGSLQHW